MTARPLLPPVFFGSIGVVLGAAAWALALLAVLASPLAFGMPCEEEFKNGGPCSDMLFRIFLLVASVPAVILAFQPLKVGWNIGGLAGLRTIVVRRRTWLALGYGIGLIFGLPLVDFAVTAFRSMS